MVILNCSLIAEKNYMKNTSIAHPQYEMIFKSIGISLGRTCDDEVGRSRRQLHTFGIQIPWQTFMKF